MRQTDKQKDRRQGAADRETLQRQIGGKGAETVTKDREAQEDRKRGGGGVVGSGRRRRDRNEIELEEKREDMK